MSVEVGQAPFLECSSIGDRRFSALCAKIGGYSIEQRYQQAKMFADGSTRLAVNQARGRPAVNAEAVALLYRELWRCYLDLNPALWRVLFHATGLRDEFGKPGHQCQAITLWELRCEALGIKQ